MSFRLATSALFAASLLIGCRTGESVPSPSASESGSSAVAEVPAVEISGSGAELADQGAPVAHTQVRAEFPPIPDGESPPADAPLLPGYDFPSFGNIVVGQRAYFPTEDTAEWLMEGDSDHARNTWYRGEVVSVDSAAGTAVVRDPMQTEYAVPLSYIQQGPAPTAVEPGQIYLGRRFHAGNLVMVTNAEVDEYGGYETIALDCAMPDDVRFGYDRLEDLVPVNEGGAGSNAVCDGPAGVHIYRIIRRAPGRILGYDGSYIRILDEENCVYAPLQPSLSPGDQITFFLGNRSQSATVRAVNAAEGTVSVSYSVGDEVVEELASFSLLIPGTVPGVH